MVEIKRITRTEEEDVRILIRHALEDMDYGGGGTYTIDPGGEPKADEHSIKRAKRGIAVVSQLLEELRR